MDFPTLEGLINTALATPPFTVSGAGLSSPDITTLFTNQLGADTLSLANAVRQSTSASSIVVQGELTGPYLGGANLDAVATFTVVGSTAEVAIVLTGFPSGWSLATAFPTLQGGWLDRFTYTAVQFTLDSQNRATLPPDFPSQYGMAAYPAALAGQLVPGLSFQATLALNIDLPGITWLLGAAQFPVSGAIGLLGTLPSVLLVGTPGGAISVGSFSAGFALSLVSSLVQPADGTAPVALTSCLQAESDFTIALTNSTLSIPVYARTFSQDPVTLTIQSNLAQLSDLVLDDIATLIGGSVADQIPDGFPALDAIGLQSIALTIAPATQTVVSASALIAFQPAQSDSWKPFGDLVEFQGMTITFTYLPSTSEVETGVACTAQIANGTLEAGISLPETSFFCQLASGSTIDISSAIGDVPMGGIDCTALKFFGSVKDNLYRFQAEVTSDWTLTIPESSQALGITEIGMDLAYVSGTPPSAPTGEIVGTFTVAGVPLNAVADYDGPTGGWAFEGGTEGPQSIDIGAVVDDALNLFGLALPSTFPQLTLANLNISYNTATNAFALLGMASVTVAGTACDFGIEISTDTGSTVFDGYLWIGDNAFQFAFSEGTATVLAGSWVSTDASPSLTLDDLLAALDLPLPALPSSVDLALTGAALVYDITNNVVIAVADTASYGSLLFVTSAGSLYGLSIAVTTSLNLTNLPLVGAELAKIDTIEIDQLALAAANQPLATAGPALNALLANYADFLPKDATYASFPTPGTGATTQVLLTATFDYGSGTVPLALPLDGGSTALPPRAGDRLPVRGEAAAASPAADGTTWFDIQRSFGPLAIQRVGALYQSAKQSLWFEIDATLAFGPLSLTLQGLGLGSPLTDFSPTFDLQGFGVGYTKPPVALSGGLVNLAPPGSTTVQFEGGLLIGAEDFIVEVLGYYGNNLGFPSMFIFGDVAHDFGGPPPFFVTGVALGFGYNSSLTLPTIDQVATFPFVEVLPTSTFSQPNVFGGSTAPLTVLGTITGSNPPWVSAVKGDLWIAAGITFTSFELVNSQAMLIVEAGNNWSSRCSAPRARNFPRAAATSSTPTSTWRSRSSSPPTRACSRSRRRWRRAPSCWTRPAASPAALPISSGMAQARMPAISC